MRPVVAAICAGALVGGLAVAAEAGPRRRGKVVRIAREEPKVSTNMRYCQLYDIDVGSCTREVKAGDSGWVIDAEGAYGLAQITEANPVVDSCGTTTAWNVVIDMSQLTTRDYSYNAVLVLDHRIAENAQLLPTSQDPPAGRPGELVSHVIDDDGDGQGDVLITTYSCDDHGAGAQSYAITHTCVDFWVEVRDEWRHARTDMAPLCRR